MPSTSIRSRLSLVLSAVSDSVAAISRRPFDRHRNNDRIAAQVAIDRSTDGLSVSADPTLQVVSSTLNTYANYSKRDVPDGVAVILTGGKPMMNPDLRYFRAREQQEREAATRATCNLARQSRLASPRLNAKRSFQPETDAAKWIDTLMKSLRHGVGDKDILVARRQQRREATGDALAAWTEIVNRLAAKREWLRGGTGQPAQAGIIVPRLCDAETSGSRHPPLFHSPVLRSSTTDHSWVK